MSLLNMLENKVAACGYEPVTGALACTQHCRKDEGGGIAAEAVTT